jgi:hypothetical protein
MKLFQGEMMTCILCKRTECSHPDIITNWRAITITGRRTFYACPDHFPPDSARPRAFCNAYTAFIIAILHAINEEHQ